VRTHTKTFYYNCCSTSPSASVTSTTSLCPRHLPPDSSAVQLAPHLKFQHWLPLPAAAVRECLPPLPSPYLYSSTYELDPVSSSLSSGLSVEHIYSQIPSPQPTPKFSTRYPQQ
jgi:hypothetical protein